MKDIDECFQRNFTYFFRIAYNIFGNVPDAEDVLQETYLKLLQKKPQMESTKNYIARMVYNLSVDVLKKERKNVSLECTLEPKTKSEGFVDKSALFEGYISQLIPKDRLVLDLFYREDLSLEEISEIMGDSSGSVKVRLHRARKKLKEIMQQDAE